MKISCDENLKTLFRAKNLEVHLDQEIVHFEHVYVLTKVSQDPKFDVHDQLKMVLLIYSQLVSEYFFFWLLLRSLILV